MLERLHIKNDYLLIAGAVFLLVISYELAFKRSVEAWQIHQQLTRQIQSVDLGYQPAYEERKSRNLDKLLALYKTDTGTFRSVTVSIIAAIAEKENVKLIEVPNQDPFYQTDKFKIQKLSFEGNYFSLLKLINRLQNTLSIGVIRSSTLTLANQNDSKIVLGKLKASFYLEIAK